MTESAISLCDRTNPASNLPELLSATRRVHTIGKHLCLDRERFVVRGVTYGSFRARADGHPFPEPHTVRADFAAIAASGLNTVRIYELPPPDVLEAASEHDMRLIVGLDYADWRTERTPGRASRQRIRSAGRRAVDQTMESCSGRSEVLAISVGNEVPADLVRVHGIRHVEDILSELADAVHDADPNALVTYSNYPTTEYLVVRGLDICSFNVFLDQPATFTRYLRHLQVVSGYKPLLITELGLAAEVHGEQAQAELLEQQLRAIDEVGCAGATVFSWTDDWSVAGNAVEGWGFGLTDAGRTPKPALHTVGVWANRGLKDLRPAWPRVSVVVCAYNEQATIEECLTSLEQCDYPDLEVIVCDDGSVDRTLELCRRFPFRILELEHGGLSRARNAGIHASSGDIVAFLDADAACHAQWPWFLVLSFDDPAVGASGGPNLPVLTAGLVERGVALSPGAPTEVLVADDRAEHVAGCNMAFRREDILGIGGFNPSYTAAGDDVDVCWKLLDAGREIAFSPAAQVMHHRRGTARGYLRQQRGYGRAEKLLSGAHRHRFNSLGQARWSGFIYGNVGLLPKLLRPVVYHGYQGHAPFQSVKRHRAESAATWAAVLLPFSVPIAILGLVLGLFSPWFLLLPVFVIGWCAAYVAAMGISAPVDRREPQPVRLRCLVGTLHLLQPFVRTWGRLRGARAEPEPGTAQAPCWVGDRRDWLLALQVTLQAAGLKVSIGRPEDRWDLRVTSRGLARARITTAVSWRWIPHSSVSVRPTWQAAVLASLLPLALLRSPALLAGCAVGLVSLVAAQYLRLDRKVDAALRATTVGAVE